MTEQQGSTDSPDQALWDRLMDLMPQIEVLVADSPCDFGINDHCLARDGRWLYTVDSAWEQVTVEEIIDDLGLEQFVAELERQLETEGTEASS